MLLFHTPTIPVSVRPPATVATRIYHKITACVADEFGLDAVALRSRTRGAPHAAYARQVAMYLAHVGFALSFETIGRVFNRDRTTVAHACRVVEDSRDDVRLDRRLAALELMVGETSGARFQGAPDAGI